MVYHGRIERGRIVLDEPLALPDGTEVELRALQPSAAKSESEGAGKTLYDRLSNVIGTAEGLPGDAALNHDHYLYGLPRK
jgi:hypothetical protein